MSAKSKGKDDIDRLAKRLAKFNAAQRRKFLNEDILRLEKNGDISYETVRTVGVREDGALVDHNGRPVRPKDQAHRVAVVCEANHGSSDSGEVNLSGAQSAGVENPANSNLLPDNLPETPASQGNGNLIGGSDGAPASAAASDDSAQLAAPKDVAAVASDVQPADHSPSNPAVSCHETEKPGNQLVEQASSLAHNGCPSSLCNADAQPTNDDSSDPLEELLRRALKAAAVRTGRPRSLDDQAKGQLIALLSVGMSMRQAAAVLGVSHTTVQNTLKADPALADSITAARFQAQLQPLACVIREARRSWKAATWLLKYLDAKIASHEETPDERRQRQRREADEFFARSPARGVKQRKVLG